MWTAALDWGEPIARSYGGATLLLRPLRALDAAIVARQLGQDGAARRLLSDAPHPCNEAGAAAWIASRTRHGRRAFAILRRADAMFLGVIALSGSADAAEIGYYIAEPYRGRGYATEALALVIGVIAEEGVACAHADTFPENTASARVLAKSGFRPMGRIRYGMRRAIRHTIDLGRRDGNGR